MKKDFVEGNLFLHLLGHLKGKYQRSFQGILKKSKKNKPTLFFESRLIRSYALLNPSKVLVIKLMFSKSSSSMDAPASMRLSSTSTSAS